MQELIKELRELEKKLITEWIKPRTFFAAMFYITLCILILQDKPVPNVLADITIALMAFYFGSKMPEQKKKEE